MANGSFLGQKTKITVVRKLKLDDVAKEYGQIRPGTETGDFIPDCPFFNEGDEFVVVTGGDTDCTPAGFCDWAWADIWMHRKKTSRQNRSVTWQRQAMMPRRLF